MQFNGTALELDNQTCSASTSWPLEDLDWTVGTLGLAVVLGTLNVITVMGNIFVMVAIWIEPHLRRAQYALIFTLALADLIVGLAVMPIAAVTELQKRWDFGVHICELWLLIDVCVCTASILHLVAIALDRYWSVTSVRYISQPRLRFRTVMGMLVLIWSISLIVSSAPYIGWNDDQFYDRILYGCECLISQVISYQIFSTMTAFYIPLCFLIFLYWKLHGVARTRIRTINQKRLGRQIIQAAMLMPIANLDTNEPTCASQSQCPLDGGAPLLNRPANKSQTHSNIRYANDMYTSTDPVHASVHRPVHQRPKPGRMYTQVSIDVENTQTNHHQKVRQIRSEFTRADYTKHKSSSISSRPSTAFSTSTRQTSKWSVSSMSTLDRSISIRYRLQSIRQRLTRSPQQRDMLSDTKAWRTVAVVTGSFVACWLPFFMIAIARPFIGYVDDTLSSVTLWLGYANSTINPIIYTVFSPDFQRAFRTITKRCGCRRKRSFY